MKLRVLVDTTISVLIIIIKHMVPNPVLRVQGSEQSRQFEMMAVGVLGIWLWQCRGCKDSG